MIKMRIFLISILVIFSAISCSPTIKNFDSYQKQFLTKSNFLPSEEAIAGKPPKIAVFNFDENNIETAMQSGLGQFSATNIENIIKKYHLGDLVDRKAVDKLQKEVALSEMKKTGSYKGPQVAEYAVSGSIANAGFSKKYSSGTTYFDPKAGRMISIPPRFSYKGDVAGNITIYELPSMSVVNVVNFSGNKTRTENVQQKGGVNLGGLQIGGEQAVGIDRDDSLVRKAAEDGIDNAVPEIRNALSQKGYILEKRAYKNKSIFKISLGSENGLEMGDKFEISGQFESENSITGKLEVERRVIGDGVVSDKIDPKTSWVIVNDDAIVSKIRVGDSVKMKYKNSMFNYAIKATKSLIE